MKKRKSWLFLFILVLAVAGMIFFFSAQSGEKSADVSKFFTEKFLKIFDISEIGFNKMEHLLRKAAHFIEFFILGAVLSVFLSRFFRSWVLTGVISCGMALVYAAVDEAHQYFIPGRSASVKDVLLDAAGAFCGVVTILLLQYLVSLFQKRKRKMTKNPVDGQGESLDKNTKI